MKIVVLAGGLSPERNVSLSSGAMVCEALRARGHQAALVDLFFGLEGRSPAEDPYEAPVPQELKKVSPQAPDLDQVRRSRKDQSPSSIGPGVLELCAGADVVFLALHGACGEDGRVQAALDLLGVPYTGSGCLGSAIAMDKDMTKRLVAGLVTTPRWETVTVTEENLKELAEKTPLPAVVKPIANGSSIGVTIAHDRETLRRGLAAPPRRCARRRSPPSGRRRWGRRLRPSSRPSACPCTPGRTSSSPRTAPPTSWRSTPSPA